MEEAFLTTRGDDARVRIRYGSAIAKGELLARDAESTSNTGANTRKTARSFAGRPRIESSGRT